MSRSLPLATLLFAASLTPVATASSPDSASARISQAPAATSQAASPASTADPASAQDPSKPAPKKTKKVWTNENLGDASGTISVVGSPQDTPASKTAAKSAPDKPVDPKLVAGLRQRVLALQQQLDSVEKELRDLQNFSKGDSKGSGGLKSSMNYSLASVDDQIRALTQKKNQIQAALDAVFDAARAKGIEPGQLR
jgi:hypothetical protein